MIKLIALDLDNTLLMEDHTIPADVADLLRAVAAKGIKVVFATGRSFASPRIYAKELGIDCAAVCYNGTVLRKADGTVIDSKMLSAQDVKEVMAFCREEQLYFQAYTMDSTLVERISEWTARDNDNTNTHLIEMGDSALAEPFPSPKIVILATPERLAEVHPKLKARFGDRFHSGFSLNYILEVNPKDTTKQTMLSRYASLCGIQSEEVLACGDHLNDLEMIRWAGIGVAVANAVPGLKEAADFITKEERSYGVAEAIRKFCF